MRLDPETAGLQTEYAYWQEPGGPLQIQYSLPVFHEIDFQVNEGYRRIPHGGVETGGILWGRMTPDVITVEAFRQIDCEHASGPSFLLSERDLEALPELFSRAASEEELRSLEPVGWFVAHTRGPLTLTGPELVVFNRLFPGPGKITMLVKPERFQPTRFGFLLRQSDGSTPSEAADRAFILPLPGRAGKGVAASIPAPGTDPAAARSQTEGGAMALPMPADVPKPQPPSPASLPSAPIPVAAAKQPASTAEVRSASTPEVRSASGPAVLPEPAAAQTVAPPTASTAETGPAEIRRRRAEHFRGVVQESPPPAQPVLEPRKRPSNTTSLFFLLLLAAGLGCALGYFAYLQLPSPYIELQAQKRSSGLLVQWPPVQTRGVEYAAVRVDDGPPQLLTDSQKESGVVEVPTRTSNTKVEIIAQHWIRDSRGIVRYISPQPKPVENPIPAASKPPASARPARKTR